MLKQTVVYPHQRTLLSDTKEWTSDDATVWVDLKGVMLSEKANLQRPHTAECYVCNILKITDGEGVE